MDKMLGIQCNGTLKQTKTAIESIKTELLKYAKENELGPIRLTLLIEQVEQPKKSDEPKRQASGNE